MRYPKWVGRPNWIETLDTPDLQFFDRAYQNFLDSASKMGEIKVFYRIAGLTVCLKFAGNGMVDALTPALEHLRTDASDECALTICIWDSFSTNGPLIEFPWSKFSQEFRGEVEDYNTVRILTVVDIHTKVLNVLDRKRNIALYWIKDRRELPWWIGGSPLQLILYWRLRTQGYQLTHVAAVGYPEGGVLLAGKSGSGKSTTTLACMKAGMKYVAEDYCFLSDLPNIWAYSIYNSSKIGEKTLHWFPELEKHIVNVGRAKGDKAFLFHHQFQPEKILFGCPIKAVITLKIEQGKNSWLESIDPKHALAALSISTLWQLTHTGPMVFNHLKRISEALPCYCLHIGEDLMQAPQLIEGLL